MGNRQWYCIHVEGTCQGPECTAEFNTIKQAQKHADETGHQTSIRKDMETLIDPHPKAPTNGRTE